MGLLVNTEYFIEVPKTGYTKAPKKSQEYRDWWKEQARRCKYGYSIGGNKITGYHYYYLNFKTIPVPQRNGSIKEGHPLFMDLDYEYFNIVEYCEFIHKGLCALKARRKGFSHKSATVIENKFLFYRNSASIIASFKDEYSTDGTMVMVKESLNKLITNGCDFSKNMYPNTADYIRASYRDAETGEERGIMSKVYSLTYGTNTNAAAGKMIVDGVCLFEEGGEFKNLIKAYGKTEPCWRVGDAHSGIPIIQGTGGDMEEGCEDFAEMFYNPDKYNMLAFDNKYSDEQPELRVGYFCPATKFYYPYIDDDGNSDEEKAKERILNERAILEGSSDPQALYDHCIAYPLTPEQAFLATHPSPFNKSKLMRQINSLNREAAKQVIERGNLEWSDKQMRTVKFVPDKKGKFKILKEEHPKKTDDNRLYIAAVDPYSQDKTHSSPSKGCMYVFKRMNNIEESFNLPVAEYFDRPDTEDEFLENCYMLACYYNCKIMFESNNKGWFVWFRLNNAINILSPEPMVIIRSITPKHKSTFKYGIAMTEPIKQDMIIKIKDYIETSCDKIFFIDLLKELLKWHDGGNFDRFSAFGICLLHNLSIYQANEKEEIAGSKEEWTKWYFRNGKFMRF